MKGMVHLQDGLNVASDGQEAFFMCEVISPLPSCLIITMLPHSESPIKYNVDGGTIFSPAILTYIM